MRGQETMILNIGTILSYSKTPRRTIFSFNSTVLGKNTSYRASGVNDTVHITAVLRLRDRDCVGRNNISYYPALNAYLPPAARTIRLLIQRFHGHIGRGRTDLFFQRVLNRMKCNFRREH